MSEQTAVPTEGGPGENLPAQRVRAEAPPGFLDRLLATPEWRSTPGKVGFVWCLFNLVLFAGLFFAGDHGAVGPLIEIGLWIPISLVVAQLLTRPLGSATYLAAALVLSLLEEAIAYSTGGGLHGAATSLPQDWVRSVPTFVGLAAGILLADRWVGLRPSESFVTAAAVGVVIELGLGTGFNPIALVALTGAVAWVYGTITALPSPRATTPKAGWVRASVAILLVTTGTLVGGLVGLELQALLHL